MREYSRAKVGYGSDFFPFWKRSAWCRPSIVFQFFSFKPPSAVFCFPLSCILLIKFHLSFFPLLLQNFLHKEHSLGCVIPPSHTSSFPTILLSDEGRSSLPFPLFPYVFSALLPPHFLSLSLFLSACLSLSLCEYLWGKVRRGLSAEWSVLTCMCHVSGKANYDRLTQTFTFDILHLTNLPSLP